MRAEEYKTICHVTINQKKYMFGTGTTVANRQKNVKNKNSSLLHGYAVDSRNLVGKWVKNKEDSAPNPPHHTFYSGSDKLVKLE
jgi:hypothetical protein